jgi:acetyl-CoA carboxylase biotin carboxyl carrier protein
VSGGPELTPEDVQEILRLIDESPYETFELETERFTIRVGERRDDAAPAADGLVEVTAPMVGIFYRAPTPGAAPFVEVGSTVEPGTQVCIIEVMKLMNSVAAGVRGIVVEACLENGAPVQYGDVLFRVRADA